MPSSVSVGADRIEFLPDEYSIGWDIERKGFFVGLGRKVIANVSAKESRVLLEEIAKHTSNPEGRPK